MQERFYLDAYLRSFAPKKMPAPAAVFLPCLSELPSVKTTVRCRASPVHC